MNPRPLYVDVFRIDVATGETTLHLERTTRPSASCSTARPGELVHCRRTADGTDEVSAVDRDAGERRLLHRLGGPSTRWECIPYWLPDDRGAAARRLPRLRRPAPGAHGPRHRRGTVVAAVDGHSLDTLSAAADALPPTVFASRRTGEVIAARFVGDRPQVVPIDPHFAEVYAALEQLV